MKHGRRNGISTKYLAERRHAKQMAAQRFGVHFNRYQLKELVLAIQHGDCVRYDRQTNRISRWLYEIGGQVTILVYDAKRHEVVTFLSLEMDEFREQADELREQWKEFQQERQAE